MHAVRMNSASTSMDRTGPPWLPLSFALTLVFPLSIAPGARAQELLEPEPGDYVRITSASRYRTTGVLRGLSEGTLRLDSREGGGTLVIPAREVTRLEIGRFRSRGARTLRGTAVGATLGTLAAAVLVVGREEESHPTFAVGNGLGAAIGTVVGATSSGRSKGRDAIRGSILGGVVGVASLVAVVLIQDDGELDVGSSLFGLGPAAAIGMVVGLTMPSRPVEWTPVPLPGPSRCGERYWRYAGCDE